MKKSLTDTIRDGRQYMKVWPLRAELQHILPENRVIKATQFSFLVLPILAALSFSIQVLSLGNEFIPQALAFALLIISLPIQGYIWLGYRANQTLPVNLMTWFKELETKLAVEGIEIKHNQAKPRYFELACLLSQGFKKLDTAFGREYL